MYAGSIIKLKSPNGNPLHSVISNGNYDYDVSGLICFQLNRPNGKPMYWKTRHFGLIQISNGNLGYGVGGKN